MRHGLSGRAERTVSGCVPAWRSAAQAQPRSGRPREAEGCLARVEESLRLVERDRFKVPEGANLALFLVSDGQLAVKIKAAGSLRLDALRSSFLDASGTNLEANSLRTARIHFNHLVATLGATFDVRRLALTDLERHVARPLKAMGRKGKPLNALTILKEVQTFSAAWSWAARRKWLDRPFPSTGLAYPKTAKKSPFRTRSEIEAAVARGSGANEAGGLWESLHLTLGEVREVLDLVRERALHPWIFPMGAIAA